MRRVVLDELAGKGKAIHAYDRMIWIVRTGFVTLLFSAWGLLLSSIGNELAGIPHIEYLLAAMLALSLTLGVGAYAIDRNYVRRKFRVIHALDALMALLADEGERALTEDEIRKSALKPLLSVAGDTDSGDYELESGYKREHRVSLIVCTLPLTAVTIAAILLGVAYRT